jgi:hypothetical protein
VSKLADLIPAIDAIGAFGFWLPGTKLGWSISHTAVASLPTGEHFPIFVLYENRTAVGLYQCPLDALARIGDDELTKTYQCLTFGSYEQAFMDKK